MSITEFKNRISLIIKFTLKMDKETVPLSIQKIFVKLYATNLKINLTDEMINNMIICE